MSQHVDNNSNMDEKDMLGEEDEESQTDSEQSETENLLEQQPISMELFRSYMHWLAGHEPVLRPKKAPEEPKRPVRAYG